MRSGASFKHFKKRFVSDKAVALTDDDWYKIYVSNLYMNSLIKEFINSAQLMDKYNIPFTKAKGRYDKVYRLINDAMEQIKWNELQFEILDDQESKGDHFLYWYFDNDNKIPQIKVLKSENITDILIDENSNPIAYVYEETVYDEKIDLKTATKTSSSRVVKWIFEKGQTTKIDNGLSETFENKEQFKDLFTIIHIPSIKKHSERFSHISAEDYIDNCLHLDAIETDWRLINKLSGFPRIFIANGLIDKAISNLSPSGIMYVKKNPESNGDVDMKSFEVTNGLDSIRNERDEIIKRIYKNACLINPILEMKTGTSDSARNTAQLRNDLEMKLTKYMTNIAQSFKSYFKVLLEYNGFTYMGETFKVPTPAVKQSVFDEMLLKTQKIALGLETIRSILKEQGLTDDEVEKRMIEINREVISGSDVSINNTPKAITDSVQSIQGLDNSFKQSGNVTGG